MKSKFQTALITGASSGIGLEYAHQLGAQGVNLVLVARREERLKVTKSSLESRHPEIKIELISADLATELGVEAVCQRLLVSPPIDLLINNAGYGLSGDFISRPPEELTNMLRVNCLAPLLLSRAAIPGMISRNKHSGQQAAIIQLCSVVSFMPVPDLALYAATKAFMLSLSHSLAEEVGEHVQILAQCPGSTETEFHLRAGLGGQVRSIPVMSAEKVVSEALALVSGAERGHRRQIVHGIRNRMSCAVARLLGPEISARIAGFVVKRRIERKDSDS